MKRIHILPVAFAAAMFAAGGATQAFAETGQHGDGGSMPPIYNAHPMAKAPAASTTRQASAWSNPSNTVSLKEAEKLAINQVGGTVVNADVFGLGDHMYKIDLKSGNHMKRVYVNGRTGRLTIAASLDPGFDPSVIGGNRRDKDFIELQMG